ncbi:MAG: glycosyltransferase [Nitrospira sp.]|nr:glycosyltransferase [Nitrospira sp.]
MLNAPSTDSHFSFQTPPPNGRPLRVSGRFIPPDPHSTQRRPLISVILCTYNRAHIVTRALASVMGQTYPHWDLIIVDDGSTDDTARLLMPIIQSDPRMTYCYHANRGVARARNSGIALARGAYVTFIDSDDEYRPDHLSHRLNMMERHPSLSLVHGGIEYIGPAEKQYVPDAFRPGKKIHLRKCYAGGTFFARTSVFKSLRGFRNLPFATDLDFIQRMRRRGLPVAVARSRTYRYHLDSDNRLCDLYEQGGEAAILKFRGQWTGN